MKSITQLLTNPKKKRFQTGRNAIRSAIVLLALLAGSLKVSGQSKEISKIIELSAAANLGDGLVWAPSFGISLKQHAFLTSYLGGEGKGLRVEYRFLPISGSHKGFLFNQYAFYNRFDGIGMLRSLQTYIGIGSMHYIYKKIRFFQQTGGGITYYNRKTSRNLSILNEFTSGDFIINFGFGYDF